MLSIHLLSCWHFPQSANAIHYVLNAELLNIPVDSISAEAGFIYRQISHLPKVLLVVLPG